MNTLLTEPFLSGLAYYGDWSVYNVFWSVVLLEETDNLEQTDNSNGKDFSSATYCTTKELSNISGIPGRDINSALVSLKLMHKRGQDWFATKKGEKYGTIQKEGQYGKFIVWPEQILDKLELVYNKYLHNWQPLFNP